MSGLPPERHVVVLWSAATDVGRLVGCVSESLSVVKVRTVVWERFTERLALFYGRSDDAIRRKASRCGTGPFTVVEADDLTPRYEERSTTKGLRVVNVNLFDGKQRWRQIAGNPEVVHASDTAEEALRNLAVIDGTIRV